MSSAIDAVSRKAELEEILAGHGLGPGSLELVDEFPNEPLRASKCQKIAKKVYMRKSIPPEARQATLAQLDRFPDELAFLEDDWMFLKHTLLKHVCSILQRWQPDYECAKWAFYHMKRV